MDSKSCRSSSLVSVFSSLSTFVWMLVSFAVACVCSTFTIADATLARTLVKKGGIKVFKVFSSKPHFQYFVASSSVLFLVILFVGSIPPLASVFHKLSRRFSDCRSVGLSAVRPERFQLAVSPRGWNFPRNPMIESFPTF